MLERHCSCPCNCSNTPGTADLTAWQQKKPAEGIGSLNRVPCQALPGGNNKRGGFASGRRPALGIITHLVDWLSFLL